MIITKMHLSRRTLLRGLGATLALPVLDSMIPALSALANTGAAPVKRLGVFYVPNGMSMPYWFPKAEGTLTEMPPTLQSLAAFIGKLAESLGRLERLVQLNESPELAFPPPGRVPRRTVDPVWLADQHQPVVAQRGL